ncbi:PorT family protein [bacterium]|nr:PorT family protein [bacterium]
MKLRSTAGSILVLLLAQVTFAQCALAQSGDPGSTSTTDVTPVSASRLAIGIFLGGNYTMHSGGLAFPAEAPPLIRYDEGSALGLAFGIRFDAALTGNFVLSGRLFAEQRGGEFTSDPFIMEIIGRDLRPEDMQLEDELETTLLIGGMDLLLQWHPAGGGFALMAGPSLGLRLTEEFSVIENIRSPAGATFLDGSTSKEMYSDDPGLTRSMQLGVRAGAGYMLPLGSGLALGAEVLYFYPLQTVTASYDWSLQDVQGNLALLFTL